MTLAVLFAASVVGLAACSSSNTPAPEQSGGIDGEGEAAASSAPDTNPDGAPYPTDKIGTIARKGATPGNRIQNFKFLGYPEGNVAGGLQPVSLAQYFDPTGNRHKIVHIQASGVWCYFCQEETKIVANIKADLESRKAVWLISLAEGPTGGQPSTKKDLDGWINEFKAPYTHWLDPGNANLGPFYDRSALPWNCNIDAATMEILTSGTGAHTSKDAVLKDIDDALEMAANSKLRNPQEHSVLVGCRAGKARTLNLSNPQQRSLGARAKREPMRALVEVRRPPHDGGEERALESAVAFSSAVRVYALSARAPER